MTDLLRVKSNVKKMVEQGAPEADIDAYIAAEGTTVDAIKTFKEAPEKKGIFQGIKGKVQSFFGGAGQGATFGNTDELSAMVQPGEYEQNLAENQKLLQSAKEEHPYIYGAGEVAGTVAGALTGAGIASKLAPRAVQALGQAFGKNLATRALAAADVGGIQGAAYGAGTGGQGDGERLENSQTGAGLGMVAGPVGAGIAGGLGSLAERAARLFKKTPPPQATNELMGISGRPMSQIPSVPEIAQMDSVARLPKGAATGDVEMMRAEEMARQGLLGQDHQQLMAQVDKQVVGDITDATQAMAKGRADSEEAFNGVLERMKTNFQRQKSVASNLMEKRNRALASTKLYSDYTKGTLGEAVKELSTSPDFKVALASSDNKGIKESLDYLSSLTNGKEVEFADLAAWRRSLNNMQPGTQSGVLAGQMGKLYDEWLDSITKNAFKEGDEKVVEKIFSANKNYKQFKDRFGTNAYKGQNSAIERILQQEELTPGQAVNLLFGKNVRGRDGTAQNVGRILSGFTNDETRNAVRQDIRSGLILRAFENSMKGEDVSLPIFRNNLMNLKRSEAYKSHLSDPDYDAVIDGIIRDIGKFSSAQSRKDVYSPSAPAMIRMTQGVLDGLGRLTGGVGGRVLTENLRTLTKEGAKASDRRLVEKSVAEFAKQLNAELNKTPRIYGAAAAGTLATPTQ